MKYLRKYICIGDNDQKSARIANCGLRVADYVEQTVALLDPQFAIRNPPDPLDPLDPRSILCSVSVASTVK